MPGDNSWHQRLLRFLLIGIAESAARRRSRGIEMMTEFAAVTARCICRAETNPDPAMPLPDLG